MEIKTNIYNIRKDIPKNVKLVCVTKTKSIEEIKQAYSIGERDFGENKVQELLYKYEHFDNDVRWHFIGHLQRNKVKYIAGKVYLIHSLDSVRLLNEIEKRYSEKGRIANVLIQINIGREKNKTGLFIEDLDELLKHCEKCSNVKVKGLMAIIPKGDEKSCSMHFRNMKHIFDELKENEFNNINMEILSMGMSGDYKIAIDEGSNMIRIGQGIFGKRIYDKGGV
ncbi:hypothetical protein CLTEP_00530 [Clostridium tepidiprofundi DSM 19306]|uniref:Pyridoxal phosphate homeostasis protein n=1 Tax=Clostridium tepidiprofundi DSM 19306 TaxID=1121338 RepID=A0A151B789_9CLOT|nr:YggS family pyridoxal phosphate-dependent enzyme [Clostridium tepidiprofundi]KYH35660.1 hypothetical protein CLTEP_00530 [Clostridium tepidiprofundi DSM 19306]